MNAKNAPLTPASPHRCFPVHFLRLRAVKNALTRPTLSYTALQDRRYRHRRYGIGATVLTVAKSHVAQEIEWNSELEPERISACPVFDQHIVVPLKDQCAVPAPGKRYLRAEVHLAALVADAL